MNDERTLLDKRIAWLEYQVVRLVWGVIALASLLVGYVAYTATVDYLHLGRWVALGVAVAAWLIAGWWLERTEFKGAPDHITTSIHGDHFGGRISRFESRPLSIVRFRQPYLRCVTKFAEHLCLQPISEVWAPPPPSTILQKEGPIAIANGVGWHRQ